MPDFNSVLMVVSLLATLGGAPDPEHDEALRDPRNIIFEGVESFDAAKVRKKLALDIDVQAAGHPQKPLEEFLETISQTVRAGYRHSGFPDATIMSFADEQRRGVDIYVIEGERYRCGNVAINGLDAADAQKLTQALTGDFQPRNVVPVTVWQSDGSNHIAWETTTGKPATRAKPIWKIGEPAAIDAAFNAGLNTRINEFFRAEGRWFADAGATFDRDRDSQTMTMTINIDGMAGPAPIGRISVKGAKRNSEAEILKYLGVPPGTPYTGRLGAEVERRLWESGRFVTTHVSATLPPESPGIAIPVKIVVVEHPKSPRLSESLRPEEQALLKMRDWLARWAAGDYDQDLVCDLHCDLSPPELDRDKLLVLDARLVMSPQRGQVLAAVVTGPDGKAMFALTVIADENRIALFSPISSNRFEIKHASTTQLLATATCNAIEPGFFKSEDVQSHIGYSVKSRPSAYANPFAFVTEIDPAALLIEARKFGKNLPRSKDGSLIMRGKDFHFAIDERTGGLQDFRLDADDGKLEVRIAIEPGALRLELDKQQLLMARSANLYDPANAWNSFGVYVLDEYCRIPWVRLSPDDRKSLAALRMLLAIWTPEPVSDLVAAIDDGIDSPDSFRLPKKRVQWALPSLRMLDFNGSGTIAGHLLPLYRELVPHVGWFWPLGRDALLTLVSRPAGSPDNVGQYPEVLDSGPLGHLTAAMALRPFAPKVAVQLASRANDRMSAQAFRADYEPFLSDDSWLGRNLLSLAAALRQLDETEIRALSNLLPLEVDRREVADCILLLKAHPLHNLRDVLPVVLDQLWNTTMKSPVDEMLRTLAAGKAPTAPKLLRDVKVVPASN